MTRVWDRAGGPAFPTHRLQNAPDLGRPLQVSMPGMTLRNWFAGQALVAATSALLDAAEDEVEVTQVAELAYDIADAMLAERAKGGE